VATIPPNPLTAEDLRAIENRLAACTPGPWRHRMLGFIETCDQEVQVIGVTCQRNGTPLPAADNAEFIAHARDDVPRLIAEVRRLQHRVQQLESAQRTGHKISRPQLVER